MARGGSLAFFVPSSAELIDFSEILCDLFIKSLDNGQLLWMIDNMKITQAHQETLSSLFYESARKFYGMETKEFVEKHKALVESGAIKVQKSIEVNCFGRLLKGEALRFVCDEIYKYADDNHLATFYKKLYKKYS